MSQERFNAYKIMWIIVSFDLPTETKKDRKAAAGFRKRLLADGFSMFQYSIYIRHCPSRENSKVHIQRIQNWLPQHGKVSVFEITDKQFGNMIIYHGRKEITKPNVTQQLELF